MNKIKILLIVICIGINLGFSQFTLSGNVKNYKNQTVFIYKKASTDDDFQAKITTDADGNFTYSFKQPFTGMFALMFEKEKTYTLFVSENKNITFSGEIINNDLKLSQTNSEINQTFFNQKVIESNKAKIEHLEQLNKLYTESEPFKKEITTEISNLKQIQNNNFDDYPFLKYYKELVDLSEAEITDKAKANEAVMKLKDHFINDGEELENSGLIPLLYMNFMSATTFNAQKKAEQIAMIKNAIDDLLGEVDAETSRGQHLLVASLNFLNRYPDLVPMANEYLEKYGAMKCEITPELKEKIEAKNNLVIGKAFPDLKFSEKKLGKYKSLYDIKSKYKIIIVWASWCPHCQQEKGKLKELYEELQPKGWEFISYAVETNRDDFNQFSSDIKWINDTELLYWSSSFVKKLNVNGTPTFYILDKNNTLLAIKDKAKQLTEFIDSLPQ